MGRSNSENKQKIKRWVLMEIWKSVKGFEGFYEVSDLGRVRSVKRTVLYKDGRMFKYESVLLKKTKDPRGYLQVGFNKNGKKSTHRIHRLVAENFIFNNSNDKEVNHIDGVKENNRLDNLEWVTSSENTKKGYELGLFEKARKKASERWRGHTLGAKHVDVFDKSEEEWITFDSAVNASLHFGWAKNYFTQLLRVGGENKRYKVRFSNAEKTTREIIK